MGPIFVFSWLTNDWIFRQQCFVCSTIFIPVNGSHKTAILWFLFTALSAAYTKIYLNKTADSFTFTLITLFIGLQFPQEKFHRNQSPFLHLCSFISFQHSQSFPHKHF